MALQEDNIQNLSDELHLETMNRLSEHILGDVSESHVEVSPVSCGLRSENLPCDTDHVSNYEGSIMMESSVNLDTNVEEESDEASIVSLSKNVTSEIVNDDVHPYPSEELQTSRQDAQTTDSAQQGSSDISNKSSLSSTKSDDRQSFIFTCPFCFVRCQEADELKDHLASHAQVKIVDEDSKRDSGEHRCSECEKAFNSLDQLESHQQVHKVKPETSEFNCDTCRKSFHTRHGLSNHQSTHELDKYQCGECKQYFMDEENLMKHFREHLKKEFLKEESDNKRQTVTSGTEEESSPKRLKQTSKGSDGHKCSVCEKVFPERSRLTRHLRTHTGEKPFKCKTCSKAFSQKIKLLFHERVHSGEKPYQCPKCDKAFALASGLKQHSLLHTGEKPYSCLHCGQKFRLGSSLRVHQAKHITTRNFKCGKCSKSFKIRRSLNRHVKRVHRTPGRHECRECGETFSTKTRLTSHEFLHKWEKEQEPEQGSEIRGCDSDNGAVSEQVKLEHVEYEGKKKLECTYCHKPFQKPSTLMRHERIHTGEKPYKCRFCPKGFARKDGHIQHERIHTGEKPFTCRYCQTSYRTLSGKNDHEKTHLKCSVCRKKFRTVAACEAHESTHNEGLMYKCKKCEKSFASLRYVTYHMRIHEDKSEILECELCGEVFGTKGRLSSHRINCHNSEFQNRSSESGSRVDHNLESQGIDPETKVQSYLPKVVLERAIVKQEMIESVSEQIIYDYVSTVSKESGKLKRILKEGEDNSNDDEMVDDDHSDTAPSESGDPDWTPSFDPQCQYCPKVCNTVSQFVEHKNVHVRTTGKKSHKCGFCGKTFEKLSRRVTHERIHTGEKPFKCEKCPRAFSRKDTLKKHRGTHSDAMPYSCVICNKAFKHSQSLNVHVKNVHVEETVKICRECGKDFKTNKALAKHKLIHSSSLISTGGIRLYICQFCQENFKRLEKFSQHLRNLHGEFGAGKGEEFGSSKGEEFGTSKDEADSGDQMDDENDSDYIPEEEMDDHDRVPGKVVVTFYQCNFCVQKRTTIKGLESHERTHTDERTYKCAKCSEGFVREEMIKVHEENGCKHDDRKEAKDGNKKDKDSTPVPCNVCGKIFENESRLKYHRRSHNNKKLTCSACGDKFASKTALKEHRKSQHSVDIFRNYYCTECPKSYMQKKSLEDHIDTCHKDSTRIKCEHCGETFVNEGWLKKHMYSYHHEVLVVQQALKSQTHMNVDLEQGESSQVDLHQGPAVEVGHNTDKLVNYETLHVQSAMDCIETLAAFSSLQGEVLSQEVTNRVSGHQGEQGLEMVEVEINSIKDNLGHGNSRLASAGDGEDLNADRLDNEQTGEVSTPVQSETPVDSLQTDNQATNEVDEESPATADRVSATEKAMLPPADPKIFLCEWCSRTFKKQSQLRNHERTHTGEKPFLCNQCGKGFKVLSGLRAHEDRHKETKRYKCTECPKAYSNPSGLQEHLDAHRGIKRYQCDECPKQFRQHQSLKEHLDVHRGFRKYQCDTCPRSFSQRRSWRMHMRTHGKML